MQALNEDLVWSTTGTGTYAAEGDISESALYSQPIDVRHVRDWAAQVLFAGATCTGSVKIQMSCDDPAVPGATGYPVGSAMTWTDIDGSSQTVSAAGSKAWNAQAAGYNWARVAWTETAGAAGSIVGRATGKG